MSSILEMYSSIIEKERWYIIIGVFSIIQVEFQLPILYPHLSSLKIGPEQQVPSEMIVQASSRGDIGQSIRVPSVEVHPDDGSSVR